MKISGTLPKGDKNGVALLDNVVAADPDTRHVVIVILSTKKLVTDVDAGDTEALLRIDRIERILPADAERAEQMLRRALEKRSGSTVLPIDIENEIKSAFRDAMIPDQQPDEGDNPQGVVDAGNGDDDEVSE